MCTGVHFAVTGAFHEEVRGKGTCSQCGFCMSGEMASLFSFRPDTILAGMKLRV